MAKSDNGYENLLSLLITDIKAYSGKDPLIPWIRGIRKMKENLPPQMLKEKLPRFLQKCAQSFESDKRYRNDSRYIRVWLQLMDFVDDPKALLRTMEANSIGTKRSLFYQAYALYYEKMKKFDEAEKMYRLGVQNFAEPMDELQKSYEQFLSRMEKHMKKKMQRQELKAKKRPLSDGSDRNKENSHNTADSSRSMSENDDTHVVKFVDTAIVGKSEAEDACHHGLVDPTINMREAMNAINNMFKEPIETFPPVHGRSQRSLNGFGIFVDEKAKNVDTQPSNSNHNSFEIFIDDENCDETTDENEEFVFLRPKDDPPRGRFGEDTVVVHRFVGSTISDEPVVENACHHGLVDPTINLKEAMEDINNMFGEPIDFVRPKRSKRRENLEKPRSEPSGGFIILEDEPEHEESQPNENLTGERNERDLFEPTMCTKEAVDEINKLFAMPMDF